MRQRDIAKGRTNRPPWKKMDDGAILECLRRAGITDYKATRDETGFSLYFKK